MLFVAHEARMNAPVLDGEGKVKSTVRDELMGLWQRNPERYEPPPEIPPEVKYLWDWYTDVRRASGEYVTWEGIDAWARLTDSEPEPHEVSALLSIDAVYRNPPKKEEEGF